MLLKVFLSTAELLLQHLLKPFLHITCSTPTHSPRLLLGHSSVLPNWHHTVTNHLLLDHGPPDPHSWYRKRVLPSNCCIVNTTELQNDGRKHARSVLASRTVISKRFVRPIPDML